MALADRSIKRLTWTAFAWLSLGSFVVGVGGGFLLAALSALSYLRDSTWPDWRLERLWAAPAACEPTGACSAIQWLWSQHLVDLTLIYGLSFGTLFMLLAVLTDPRPSPQSTAATDA